MKRLSPLLLPMLLACQPGGETGVPGDTNDKDPYAGIAVDDVLHFTGTEPFWGGQATAGELTYTTPENIEGTAIAVERFAGRGGLSLSGELDGAAFDMMVTEGECSDGMSDRAYPFTVTLKLGGQTRFGCGWTDRNPYSGPVAP